MAVNINLSGGGENLAETLAIGNFTNDGQKMRALNGGGVLNFRLNNDGEVLLTNDDVAFLLSYLALFPNGAALGYNSGVGLYLEVTADHIIFTPIAFSAYYGWSAVGGGLWNIALQSSTQIFTITAVADNGSDVTQNSGTDFLFLNTGLSGVFNSVMKTGVQRSVIISGKGITAKTNDTTYLNQISFQEPNVLFDCILKSSGITADRTINLPDKSGTVALTSDIPVLGTYTEKWTAYVATLNATWQTITLADSNPNAICQITCEQNSAVTRDMGVRAVGSVLNRQVTVISRSSTTFTVKTNGSKEIQVYASVAADITFWLAAQF